MKKRLLIATCITALALLVVMCIMLLTREDRKAPVISYSNEIITIQDENDTELLLADVTAQDDMDGDVTETVMIESIQILNDQDKASVIYVARDKSNNVAKMSRIVNYQKEELIEGGSSNIESDQDDSGSSKALDDLDYIDGYIDEGTNAADGQEISQAESDAEAETAENNTGEESEITDEPLVSTGDPIIRLNTHSVTITAGSYFNPMNYIAEAVDDIDDAWRRIRIVGEYHVNTPGEYILEYSITDTDGNQSNVEELVLVVE